MMLFEVGIASSIDDATAVASMDRYMKAFPNDPSLLVNAIALHGLHKRYDQQLAAIEKLDRAIGGDPYLELHRADAYQALGKLDEALAAARRAVEREPTLGDAWWGLLTQQVASARFGEVAPTLSRLRDTFGAQVDRETLAADERYKALVDSPDYAAWEAAPH